MGLLKHAICPFLALLHGGAAVTALLGKFPDNFKSVGMVSEDYEFSDLERFLFFVMGVGVHGALFVGQVLSIFQANAHEMRGMIMIMEAILWSAAASSDLAFGYPAQVVYMDGFLAVVCVVGITVHAMEPGIFTKDKTSKTKNA